jgi:4-amino-4-deoxy-L-arabinose transferase-like glycosyltransferase
MKRQGPGRARAAVSERAPLWPWLGVTGLIVIVAIWLKVPSLFIEHTETDERIYWQLAENLAAGRGYTLQGTALLESLSPHIYDRPLFHHPPLFAALLTPFAASEMRSAAIVIPWLGQVLGILAVALIGLRTALQGASGRTAMSPGFWLPLLAMAADPLLGLTASRLWLDSLLTGLVAMAFAALVMATTGTRSRLWMLTAGAFLGLAALTKLTALIVLPVIIVTILHGEGRWRTRFNSLTWFSVPVCLLVVPWLVLFRLKCGVFLPDWVAPDLWLREHSDFVKSALDRPWYYYSAKLPLVLPMTLMAGWAMWNRSGIRLNHTIQLAAAWSALVIVSLTMLGATGYGFQMRHVAPAVVPLYVIVMSGLLEGEHPIALLACGCALSIGTFTTGMHVLARADEVFSLAEIARLIGF